MLKPIVRLLLAAFPRRFQREHGAELAATLTERWREPRTPVGRVRLLGSLSADWITSVAREWRAAGRRTAPRGGRPPAPRRTGGFTTDVKNALRLFGRSPRFAAAAVGTLALGIGAATAIVSLADATLLRPLPVPAPDRIVQTPWSWAPADVRDLVARQTTFSDVAGWSSQEFGVRLGDATRTVTGLGVTGAYFRMAGQTPVAGRLIVEADDTPSAAPVVVLGERLWRRWFNRDAAMVGNTIEINRRAVRVVGIAPAAFRGLSMSEAPEIFVPLASLPVVGTGFVTRPGVMEARNMVWVDIAGRLRDESSIVQAGEDVTRIYYQLHPPENPAKPVEGLTLEPMTSLALGGADTVADLRRFLTLLLGGTVVTLLLAAATVANLLLVRAEDRRRELAVRAALGAGRRRILRLLLTESVVIGLAGGVAGLLVARAALTLLGTFSLPGQSPIADLDLSINRVMLASAIGLGCLTSLVFGLAPVLRASRADLIATLRDGGRSSRRQPLRTTLVTVQVALCVVLLGGGLAFGRAIQHALAVDLGFDTERTSLLRVDPTLVRYDSARTREFQAQVLDRLQHAPWVEAAGWSTLLPMRGTMQWAIGVERYQPAEGERMTMSSNTVSPGYFEAMKIPLIAGRDFSPADSTSGARVAIVSASFAAKYFKGRSAVGGRITPNPEAKVPDWIEVVGVVGDITRSFRRPRTPIVYQPIAQRAGMFDFGAHVLVVRSSLAPEVAVTETVATIAAIDPLVPVTLRQTMGEHLGGVLMVQRLGLTLFALFAVLAVVVTVFGIYAVVAAAVAHRTREIGVRVALGADVRTIVALVVRQGLVPVVAGLAVGLAAFAASSRALEQFMLSMPAISVPTMAALASGVAAIALSAMLVPVRRALRVDPAAALRQE